MRVQLLLLTALLIAGCDRSAAPPDQASGNDQQAGTADMTEEEMRKAQEEWEKKIVLPVDPKHRKLELTPAWLEGYWVAQKSACYGSDSGIHFGADGKYAEHEAGGTYAIEGDRVTLTVTEIYAGPESEKGKKESLTVALVGPNEMDSRWPDGSLWRLYRCPPGGMKE